MSTLMRPAEPRSVQSDPDTLVMYLTQRTPYAFVVRRCHVVKSGQFTFTTITPVHTRNRVAITA